MTQDQTAKITIAGSDHRAMITVVSQPVDVPNRQHNNRFNPTEKAKIFSRVDSIPNIFTHQLPTDAGEIWFFLLKVLNPARSFQGDTGKILDIS
ncbi:hypothetical protein LAD77_01955 [Klebsiella pneumoniae]|nr:hypothetical protein [Klebsiella pneumoniae]